MSNAREVSFENKSNRIMKQAWPYLKPFGSSGGIGPLPWPWQQLSHPSLFLPNNDAILQFLSIFACMYLDYFLGYLPSMAWHGMTLAAMVGLTPLPGSNYRGRGNMSKLSLIGDDISIIPLKLLFSAKSPASAWENWKTVLITLSSWPLWTYFGGE